jgi:hypothetical protein
MSATAAGLALAELVAGTDADREVIIVASDFEQSKNVVVASAVRFVQIRGMGYELTQRVAHLLQHGRIVVRLGKFLGCHLVRDTRVAHVMGRLDDFSPPLVRLLPNPGGQRVFEVEQALLVMLNVHDVVPTTLRV